MTIDIQNMWLEEKNCESISSFCTKLECLTKEMKANELFDIESLSGSLCIMFHGLTKVKLGQPIWDDTSLTLVRQWL